MIRLARLLADVAAEAVAAGYEPCPVCRGAGVYRDLAGDLYACQCLLKAMPDEVVARMEAVIMAEVARQSDDQR